MREQTASSLLRLCGKLRKLLGSEYSSGSSGRLKEGRKKHEIYVAAFGSHLFMTYFYRAGGGVGMAPWISPGSITVNNIFDTRTSTIVVEVHLHLEKLCEIYRSRCALTCFRKSQ